MQLNLTLLGEEKVAVCEKGTGEHTKETTWNNKVALLTDEDLIASNISTIIRIDLPSTEEEVNMYLSIEEVEAMHSFLGRAIKQHDTFIKTKQ